MPAAGSDSAGSMRSAVCRRQRSLDFAHARSVFEKFSRVKFFAPPYADSVRLARLALGPAQECGAKSEYQKSLAPEALHELRVQTRKGL